MPPKTPATARGCAYFSAWPMVVLCLPLMARPASAVPTIFTPEVEQCEGSFGGNTLTRLEPHRVRTVIQDSSPGLKIGQQAPALLSGTRGLWHWDGTYQVHERGCAAPCNGLVCQRTWNYYYTQVGVASTATVNAQGLRGEYFSVLEFHEDPPFAVRIDTAVDYLWPSAEPISGMGVGTFSIRWSGVVITTTTGSYTFCETSDDGGRLWINSALNIDAWVDAFAAKICGAPVSMTAGVPVPIVYEYYENVPGGAGSEARLLMSGPGFPEQFIPPQDLRPTMDIGKCVYFDLTGNCLNTMSRDVPPRAIPLGDCPVSTTSLTPGTYSVTMPTPASPKFGQSLSFSAVLNHVASIPDSPQWDMPESYTLSAWVRTTAGGVQRIASQDDGTNYWGFGLNGSCLRRFDSREQTTPTDERTKDVCGPPLNNGNWHAVSVVRNNAVDWRYFIDGLLISTSVAKSTVSFADSLGNGTSAPLNIGAFCASPCLLPTQGFTGEIDELRVHPGVVLDNTILLEFNATVHKYSRTGVFDFAPVFPPSPYLPSTPANGTTALVTYQTPAATPGASTSHSYLFLAQNTNTLTVFSPILSVTVDKSTPSAPSSFAGTPTSPLDITWSWILPTSICGPPTANSTYTLVNANTGATVANPLNTLNFNENFPLDPPNQIRIRQLKVSDYWGTSPLSNSATVYTLANPPASLAASSISTGSLVLSWSSNSNPIYTRYEISMSPDNFTSQVSTPIQANDNFAGTSKAITGLSPGTNYSFRVRAVNGRAEDNFGGLFTVAAALSVVSQPNAPPLFGTALSESAIKWDWSNIPGATGYRLYAAGGSPLLVDTAGITFTSTTLSTNTAYGTELESYNASGPSLRTSAVFVFTRSTQPAAAVFTSVSTTTLGLSWSANTNPAYTFYEVTVATDPVFGVVVATRTGAQTSMAISGLFPATTYFARVRSLSGGQISSAFILAGSTRTDVNPAVATGTSPASAYSGAGGLIGVWHFDESTGTLALDSSGLNNNAALACLVNGCTSTPTYAAGPASLGSAASFSGLPDSLVQAPDAAPYNFGGSMSVGAWVKPTTLAQPNGAAIVAKGTATGEAFSLDVFAGKYRFLARSGFTAAIATSSLRAGHYDHVMGVYDAAAGEAHLYVNGILSNSAAGVPAPRNINSRPLAIGSRQSGGLLSSHDLGFAGSIDEVRLFNVALTAAQVRADYLGSFPGELALPPPASGVRLTLPPNAFGAPSLIYASADPFNHPIRIPLSFLADGLSSLPTGFVLIPGSLVEIVPTVGGLPFTATLGSSATLSMPYADSNGDSLIDGLQPPVAVQTLRLYTLDTSVIRWEALPTTVDKANKRVSGQTSHFSIFALFGASTIGSSLSQVRAFPNPWLKGSQGRFDAAGLTFDNLPAEGFVRILTLSGERVRELSFAGANAGRLEWDGKNAGGRAAASGVYFALIKSAGTGDTSVIKFAIER